MNLTTYSLLNGITTPDDLRRLKVEQLPEVCRELRQDIIEEVSRNPGHFAASLGTVELTVALHYVYNTPYDRIVWDVGHQAYGHKILTGRREAFSTNRRFKGIRPFPSPEESPYDTFACGHASNSISAALGMCVAAMRKGEKDRHVVAVIGDGSMSGGLAFEGLNNASSTPNNLLIILNDNDCSISPPVGALSSHLAKIVSTRTFMNARELSKKVLKPVPGLWEVAKRMEKQAINFVSPPSGIFSAYDLNYFGPVDGHNLSELLEVLRNLRKLDGPSVLHVVTKKGKGYPPAEADPTTYHGVGKFDPDVGIVPSAKPGKPTYTQVFGRWICDRAEKDPMLYGITPAMREGSGLVEFAKRFPNRYRDVAIAEQHAVTYAAGLATTPIRPVLAIYSSFLQRAIDQVIHDVALQNLPVLFAIDRGGLVGADGATHHGVFDIAQLRGIPNMVVMTPSDENECRLMLNTGYECRLPAAVRYPRGRGPGVEVTAGDDTIPIGKSRKLLEGKRVAFLGFGSMTNVLRPVAEHLGGTLIDMRFVKPLDREAVLEVARTHELIVAAEEGQLAGGACDAVLEVLADEGLTVPVMRFGLPDRFVDHGTQAELLAEVGLTSEAIEQKVLDRLGA